MNEWILNEWMNYAQREFMNQEMYGGKKNQGPNQGKEAQDSSFLSSWQNDE